MHTRLPDPISALTSPFAAFTFTDRFPFIIDQVKKENNLSPAREKELDQLSDEIIRGKIPSGNDAFDPEDLVFWEKFSSRYGGKTYFEIPFYQAEAYIYYRIIQITDYKNSGQDPYYKTKYDLFARSERLITKLATEQAGNLASPDEVYFSELLRLSLWSNSLDFSQLKKNNVLADTALRRGLVTDDTSALYSRLTSSSLSHEMDFVADNAGLELISDLFLIDYLLHHQLIGKVNLHLKKYPIFVSDATVSDLSDHLRILKNFESVELSDFIVRIETYLQKGCLELCGHAFWNSPCHFNEFPDSLKGRQDGKNLFLFKGDANYRRLFEDRLWDYTTSPAEALNYFRTPCISIRVIKSEIILGLDYGKAEHLFSHDKDWLTNGRYGLIMFHIPPDRGNG